MKNALALFNSFPPRTLAVLLAGFVAAQLAGAATATWTGGAGSPYNWSASGNWSGGTPSGSAVVFPDGASPITSVTTIVDASPASPLTSLTYNNVGTGSTHNDTTQIAASQTLTVNGNVSVGVNSSTTTVIMSGTGNFTVGYTASSIFSVGGNSGTSQNRKPDLGGWR